ncbi:MAG: glycosyltransferase family A protein [Solirubrobacteraceae bacterium]
MSSQPSASIVIPSRGRPSYLDVALASIAPQAAALGAEIIVVDDGDDPATAAVSRRHGARVIPSRPPGGANAGRNAGVDAAGADLIVMTDDDVEAPPNWLDALLAGIEAAPHADVFGGPIRGRLEGGGPRACGRESAPITTLDLGPTDRDVGCVWSANMAVRRRALQRAGPFDVTIRGRGEEEEWERRYVAAGGIVRYVGAAGLDHRRTATDATVRRLARDAYRLGRTARAYDVSKGMAPSLGSEMRTLAGTAWHTLRRRCAIGLVMGAHTAGRLRAMLPGHAR